MSLTEGALECEELVLCFFVEVELILSLFDADDVLGSFSFVSDDDFFVFFSDFFERSDFCDDLNYDRGGRKTELTVSPFFFGFDNFASI